MQDRTEYFREYNKKYREKNKEKVKELCRDWQASNKEKRNAYMRAWSAANRDKHRGYQVRGRLKNKYGLTLEDYNAMLVAQGGHCALCDKGPEQERYKKLNVDHCHETERVRGLLCTPCNHALGRLGDNETGLARALEYIQGAGG